MSKSSQRTWGGRFSTGPAAAVKAFTESVSFDWRLYKHDIAGSIAHAKGLAKVGLLTRAEAVKIEHGLRAIEREIESGKFKWDHDCEDVHMNIEAALVRKIGAPGKKLHTGRSRNDQVATDIRLWTLAAIRSLGQEIRHLQGALVALAEKERDAVIPGYTHLQRAQPVLLAHHLLAYVEMLQRDAGRFTDCAKRANVCPLGSGAIAGSTLKLDRVYVAKLLGFAGVTQNSMDAVGDRDFIVEFHAAAALTGAHLSRLAEDLILWSSAEFGFITIADAYTTGSSLMPQKKNPDIAELARGKTSRLYGNLVQSLTLLKSLPLTYNRDLQEDKQPLFKSADILLCTLHILAEMMGNIHINHVKCEAAASDPMMLATDLVDFLVEQGMAFREAHHAVGTLCAEVEKTHISLPTLAAKKYGLAAGKVFDVRRALNARTVIGAPSPKNVAARDQAVEEAAEVIWRDPEFRSIHRMKRCDPMLPPGTAVVLRRATLDDIVAVARIHRLAFFGAMPHMPVLHTPEDDLAYFSKEVFPSAEIWVAEQSGVVAGFVAFRPDWVDHLYVHPGHQGRSLGSTLLALAQSSAGSLRLWAFQCNPGARRFYERHGFRIERETDGANNAERQPDVLYVWTRDSLTVDASGPLAAAT